MGCVSTTLVQVTAFLGIIPCLQSFLQQGHCLHQRSTVFFFAVYYCGALVSRNGIHFLGCLNKDVRALSLDLHCASAPRRCCSAKLKELLSFHLKFLWPVASGRPQFSSYVWSMWYSSVMSSSRTTNSTSLSEASSILRGMVISDSTFELKPT